MKRVQFVDRLLAVRYGWIACPPPSEGMAMWNSFRTDARLGITAEVIAYSGGNGDEIHAYVARPAGDDPVPGIVAVHHMPGWDEFYREFSERLARHGYCVICPDLYCRFGRLEQAIQP